MPIQDLQPVSDTTPESRPDQIPIVDDLRHDGITASEDILLPLKRLRQQVNDTDAEDIRSLKALTQKFMNEMIDAMSAITRDNM